MFFSIADIAARYLNGHILLFAIAFWSMMAFASMSKSCGVISMLLSMLFRFLIMAK